MTSPQNERRQQRERLSRAVDQLADQASLQVQMQKDPLKMLGGASGVGVALGLLLGLRFRRTRRVYVDANSTMKEQKAFAKAQTKVAKKGGGIGNALTGLIVTVGFKVLRDRILAPQLERLADNITQRADERASAPRLTRVEGAQVERIEVVPSKS